MAAFTKKHTSEIIHAAHHNVRRVAVMLEDVRSMHNVGSAFRTLDALGGAELWLTGYTPAPPHRDIHKTALGAELTIPWQKFETTTEALEAARSAEFSIVAAEQAHGAFMLGDDSKALPEGPLLLVFGNEVTGVSDEALAASSACIEIPQRGEKHSLNVSVAVGVVLWELLRRG